VPHKFVTYLLRHLPTNLETRDPHGTTGWVTGTASSPYKTQWHLPKGSLLEQVDKENQEVHTNNGR